ncbi:MAG: cupin domain-containing protein [Phycisphaerales bacterium]|nr:cupin domain-containing protein [Phycisphaerales bacterium]
MLQTAIAPLGLRILAGRTGARSAHWSAALVQFFQLARRVLDQTQAEVRTGRLRIPAFLHGEAGDHGLSATLDSLMNAIDLEYDIELKSPFEETASIAGGLWSGRDLVGADCPDGLAKLRFSAGTLDLPLHVHEHSDRFIAVLEGEGRFWWSEEPWRHFEGARTQSTSVRAGDVLVFTRDLLHTFSAPTEDLVLLSYHSPEIPFEDPRQYTLPELRWTPREGRALARN